MGGGGGGYLNKDAYSNKYKYFTLLPQSLRQSSNKPPVSRNSKKVNGSRPKPID